MIGLVQFVSALFHCEFDSVVGHFQFCLTPGDGSHFQDALMAHDEKENIFKKHPSRVLNPAERVRSYRPEYRSRPIGAAQEMIDCHYNRRRDKDPPVPVKGEKREGAKNLEMGFYPSSSEVDQ